MVGQNNREEEFLNKNINIIKFILISKEIVSDEEYIKLIEEELDNLKENFEQIMKQLNEMR